MSEAFRTFHAAAITRVNSALQSSLQACGAPQPLREAMVYAVMNGGKRLRPCMTYAAFQACRGIKGCSMQIDGPAKALDASAQALELIHSYSLVHDDLPAMDDDELRRGKPSCHIAFGEAAAILAGDGLQALAFELLADCPDDERSPRTPLLLSLARAAGPAGMVGGQMLDLNALEQDMTELAELEALHRAKTGAMIAASLEMGGLCADASASQLSALADYAGHIGLAFQVVDDVLDITATTEQLGKKQGSDQQLGKPTYPELMGLDESRRYAQSLCDKAHETLDAGSLGTAVLHGLADFIVNRSH